MLSRFWTGALLERDLLIPQDLLEAYQSCVKGSLCVWPDIKKNMSPISGQNFDPPMIWTERSWVKLYIMVSKIQINSCKGMWRHSKPIPSKHQLSSITYFCMKLHPFVKLSLTYAHLWKDTSAVVLSFPYPCFTGILPLSFHICNTFPVTVCVWSHSIVNLLLDFP